MSEGKSTPRRDEPDRSPALHEELVAYVFGTLDAAAIARIEFLVARDARVRAERDRIAAALRPTPVDCDEPAPTGLWHRAIEFVRRNRGRVAAGPMPPLVAMRFIDVAMAAGLILAAAAVLFPAIYHAREQHQRIECRNNLRQIGVALAHYEDAFAGHLPYIGGDGPLGFAGAYAATLIECQLIQDRATFVCPGSNVDPGSVRSANELRQAFDAGRGAPAAAVLRDVGGAYGYALGYHANGGYRGLRNDVPATLVLVSDRPPRTSEADVTVCNSPNHGWEGQNVLQANFAVRFITRPSIGPRGDLIFVNNNHKVAPGVHVQDAVVAPSETRPWQHSDTNSMYDESL